jgi:hypothetical protein
VTTWPFTVTSLANGGTVTGLRITANYTSGSSTMSTLSNTLSVTIPGLPPVITSFTVTKGSILKISPFWSPVIYTWTLSGGTPTSYLLKTPGDITLTSATSPYSVTYSAPVPTWDTSSNQWQPYYFNPYMSVANNFGNTHLWAPTYYYPPGVATVALTFADSANLSCGVYIQYQCAFATIYSLQSNAGTIRSVGQMDLMRSTDFSCTAESPFRFLGNIPATPGTYTISVSNQRGDSRSCTISISNILPFNFDSWSSGITFSTTGTAPAFNNYEYNILYNTYVSPTYFAGFDEISQTTPLSFSF